MSCGVRGISEFSERGDRSRESGPAGKDGLTGIGTAAHGIAVIVAVAAAATRPDVLRMGWCCGVWWQI